MKKLLSFLVLAPLVGLGQGVHFENGLSWEQVLAKAKTENKYIFVDCYATWCGPCKRMDKEVYTNDPVGQAMNEAFVSVKVQMDTSAKDDDAVKAWYSDAHRIMVDYKVAAFPTYLFFSPDGRPVHRGVGYQHPQPFMELLADAKDAAKQYYTLLDAYRSGARDYTTMPYLLKLCKKYKDSGLDSVIAADYLHNHLDKLSYAEICTKENLEFMPNVSRVMLSKDKVFECFYGKGSLVDSVVHFEGYAKKYVDYIVTKEEITPIMTLDRKEGKDPDWLEISKHIKNKFGEKYVGENVAIAKVDWYKSVKNWKEYIKYLIAFMDFQNFSNLHNDVLGLMMLNNSAWDVFLYSEDKQELKKAIAWTDKVVENEPNSGIYLDTKANLLYKLGLRKKAIELETRAEALAPKEKGIAESLQKMRNGEPTWAAR